MRAKLIVNPVSGADAAPGYLAAMNEPLRQRFDTVDIAITVSPGDATALAAQAVRDEYDHILVAGGDGTLNEVLNGVASVDGGLDATTLGVIPLGTGNDFAAMLDIPEDVDAAVQVLLQRQTRLVDLGRLNDRCFLNVSAGGFIAEVSSTVTPELKSIAGKLAYLIGGAQIIFDFEPITATISSSSGVGAGSYRLLTFAVCNARLIGGGRLIAPHAELDDGALDICLIHDMPTLEFLGLLRRVSTGEHVADERVTYFRSADLTLVLERSIKVNTDGQVLDTMRCHYTIVPGAVRVIAGSATSGSRRHVE